MNNTYKSFKLSSWSQFLCNIYILTFLCREQIPVGGTDISPDAYTSYQKRPPSGSKGQSSTSKTQNVSSGKNRRIVNSEIDLELMYPETTKSGGQDK